MSSPCNCSRVFITSGMLAGWSSTLSTQILDDNIHNDTQLIDSQTVTAAHPARPPQRKVSPKLSCGSSIAGLGDETGTPCGTIPLGDLVDMSNWRDDLMSKLQVAEALAQSMVDSAAGKDELIDLTQSWVTSGSHLTDHLSSLARKPSMREFRDRVIHYHPICTRSHSRRKSNAFVIYGRPANVAEHIQLLKSRYSVYRHAM